MNPNDFVLSQCLVSLAGLAIIIHLFGRLRRDEFRSNIRRLRDGLFDLMLKHGYDFDTPAYRETRQLLNGIIRLSAVPMPLVAFIVTAMVYRKELLVRTKKVEADDCPLGAELGRVRKAAVKALTRFLLLRGPLVMVIVAVAFVIVAGSAVLTAGKLLVKIRKLPEAVACWAYQLGSPNLSRREYSRMVGEPECRAGA